ncbi:MAG: insulinase family protein [Saprospiraceae bacterium]|nr:insulinase family protein [Saprospiraceae bacterium]
MKNSLSIGIKICFIALSLFICDQSMAQQKGKTPTKTAAKAKKGAAKASAKSNAAQASEDFRTSVPAAGPAAKINIGKYDKSVLPNGLQVIIVENHKIPKASYQLFVDYDPITENEFAGKVSLAGELLGRGTTTRNKAQIDEFVDKIGASLSTNGNGVSGASLTKYSEQLLTIMSDVLLNPTFSADEFEKIRKQTLSGLAQNKEDANTIAANVGKVLAYGVKHPYGEIETETTIKNITPDMCRQFYKDYFIPNNSYLIIVGDVNPTVEKQRAAKYFGAWKSGTKLTHTPPAVDMNSKTTLDFVNKSGAVQSVISLTYPVNLKPNDSDKLKARVMNTMFGGFFRSRLNDNLREKHGYTYGVRSSLNDDRFVGRFSAGGSVRNEVTDSSIIEMFKEINRMKTELISDEEYHSVRNVMAGDFGRSLESPQTVANFALNIARFDLPTDYYNNYLQNLMAVSKQDILNMANKYLKPENAHIVVVGNKDIASKLAAFSHDKKVHFYDVYGKPIEMNTETPSLSASQVIDKYVQAIGGIDKVKSVTSVATNMEASLQGMVISMTEKKKIGGKYLQTVSLMGNTLQKQVCDGTKASSSVQGQPQTLTEADIQELKNNSDFCPQLYYSSKGHKLEVKGIEDIEGKKAYQLDITPKVGQKWTEYYDLASGLIIREVKVDGEGENMATMTSDLSDYMEVKGLLVPHKTVISGTMPMPLEAIVKSVKINEEIPDSEFKID